MKINAQILYHRLKRKYPVKIYGEENSNFLYSSPEFYMNNSNHFYANKVYLASVDYLPSRPLIEKNVVLICIGESNHLFYYKERATVITIQKKVDFFFRFITTSRKYLTSIINVKANLSNYL